MAFSLWNKASQKGNIEASHYLAVCFLNGEGTDQNISRAFEILKKLVEEKKYVKSMNQLGDIYYLGINVEIDYKKALYYYVKAYNTDNKDCKSKFCIARCYYYGNGVEQNYYKAFQIFYELVEKDKYEEAIYFLGVCYYLARGIEKDYKKALFYFNESIKCNKNVKYSNCDLGNMYLKGQGVEKDISKAKEYFEHALDENDDLAYYRLASIYLGAYGTYQDDGLAKKYFDKIEIDLCSELILYIIAKQEFSYKEKDIFTAILNDMFNILNSDSNINKMNEEVNIIYSPMPRNENI